MRIFLGAGCALLLGLAAIVVVLPSVLFALVGGAAKDLQKVIVPSLPNVPHSVFLADQLSSLPNGPYGPAIARAAIDIAQHLYGYPDNQYDAGVPAATMQYWQTACPVGSGCWINWQSGNLQCVLFIMGAYALAHSRGQADMLPVSGNASDYASLYADRPGWQEILPGQGFPQMGDVAVWAGDLYGHVAIVVHVDLPKNGANGKLVIAQANGPAPLEQMPLRPDGVIDNSAWQNGYQLLTYIRDRPVEL